MALFLEIYLSVIGLCKLAAVLVRLFNVLNLECEGKDLWEWVQCRRHGNLHGGGNGSKADLPELPCEATPLQFGDWLYLCGPIMKNLESPRRWR